MSTTRQNGSLQWPPTPTPRHKGRLRRLFTKSIRTGRMKQRAKRDTPLFPPPAASTGPSNAVALATTTPSSSPFSCNPFLPGFPSCLPPHPSLG